MANTNKTERYFWAVCGTSTAAIVGIAVLFGFKEQVSAKLRGQQGRYSAL